MSHLLPRERMHLLSRQTVPLIYSPIQSSEHLFTNVLLIDNSVPDYQMFVDSANSSTFPIVYSASSSKTELLALLQKMFTSISRIGIVFASSLENSTPFLDWKPLFNENEVEPYSENAQFIIDVIKEFSVTNIDYLACNTLNYSNWTNYYQLLAQNTGVVVGASNNKTGNIKYGGDWLMESTGQDIEQIYFTQSIEYYTYLLDATYSTGTTPLGITTDSAGNVYIANSVSNNVTKITPAGVSSNFASTGNSPRSITTDSAGNVYTANYFSFDVSKITPAGVSTILGTTGNYPLGITVDSLGNIYTANSGSNNVTKITPLGVVTTPFGSIVSGSAPIGIITDSAGNVYVTNPNKHNVTKITADGTSSTILGTTDSVPVAITIDSLGNIYTVNLAASTVSKITPAGVSTISFASTGTAPRGITIDSAGNLYTANSGTFANSISKITPVGDSTTFASTGSGSSPRSITIDSSGNIYTANYSNNTATKITTFTITPSVQTATVGIAFSGYTITTPAGGVITSYSISPALPDGLSFNTTTGLITGTPTTEAGPVIYTITGTKQVGGTTSQPYTLTIAGPYPCFNKDTKILTDKGYKLIQDLRKGDLVKTALHDFKPIDMIGFRDIHHPASKERIKDQLYKCTQTEYPEVFEPLILTGCHSILVDEFTSKEQRDKVIEINGNTYITDDKYRLPASADERAHVYEIPGNYTIYHVALENDDYYMNYGIFANGVLVESCSKRYLKELSNMTLIE